MGKFQEANMRTTPSGSDSTSALAGKNSNGNRLCAPKHKLINIYIKKKSSSHKEITELVPSLGPSISPGNSRHGLLIF